MQTLFILSHGPKLLLQTNFTNIRKSVPTMCRPWASLYKPLPLSTHFCFKNKKPCKRSTTCASVKTKLCNHLKQVQHIIPSQKHELIASQTLQNTKTPSSCPNRASSTNLKPKQNWLVRFALNHFKHIPYNPPELSKHLSSNCNLIFTFHLCRLTSIARSS